VAAHAPSRESGWRWSATPATTPATITSATDSAPASRIQAIRLRGRRSATNSPTHAGAAIAGSSGRAAARGSVSTPACGAAARLTTTITSASPSAAAVAAQAVGRSHLTIAADPPGSGRPRPRC
jgi:hypothetical protein